MGETTGIEWADHTFNPWWGCEKVSPACANCYAETFADRFPKTRGLWGPTAPRKIASEKVWGDPIRWDRKAKEAGVQRRVFCASMSDVLEDRRDLDDSRARLERLVADTPNLIWMFLTKRPENASLLGEVWTLPNVWAGTTVEDQLRARERIPHLLRIPSRVRFLSMEPLLGPVNLAPLFDLKGCFTGVQWVIAGGESGANPRPMRPEWVRDVRDQCRDAGVPFFMKQWGEWAPSLRTISNGIIYTTVEEMKRVGTRAAGSLLDGVDHKAIPGLGR